MARSYTIIAFLTTTLLGICLAEYCEKTKFKSFPYCNYSLPISDRVKDLLSRMTLAEKISQLGNTAGSIDRLDIPAYQWWSEGLHGVADSPGVHFNGMFHNATSFPQVITTASSFNKTLYHEIAAAMSTEARAFANQGQAGLTYFTPNINVVRDPRWGRGQETPGEDPYLNSQYAIQFVTGAQGNDPKYLKVVTTCKHYSGYDLEDYVDGETRHTFNAKITEQDLEETYLPAFKACVEDANVASIMCSYNDVNGVPSCANGLMNNKLARDKWGFDGFIASDCSAIDDIQNKHHYTNNTDDTVAAALKGGCDLNCGGYYQSYAQSAFLNGTISIAEINLALSRLFSARMKLGMFDPPELQPYTSIPPDVVNCPEHQELALNAARESIVLLQNKNDILPLNFEKHLNIAVVGPNARATDVMQGNYRGVAPYLISPVQGFEELDNLKVQTAPGCDVNCEVTDDFQDAFDLAVKADAVIVVLGLDQSHESEGHDREDLFLPNLQDKLVYNLRTTLTAAGTNAPLIAVIMSGSSVDLTVTKKYADAILWAGYPGQSGGQAIAEVIYGKVNPSGKLPITFYPGSYIDLVAFRHMSMREDPGRTYRFFNETPVFSFGDGLSYTTFDFVWTKPVNYTEVRTVTEPTMVYNVTVTNTGKIPGAVSVLAFIKYDKPGAPKKELFGFEKVFLNPLESISITFTADSKAFSNVDKKGVRSVNPGDYYVTIGDQLMHKISLM